MSQINVTYQVDVRECWDCKKTVKLEQLGEEHQLTVDEYDSLETLVMLYKCPSCNAPAIRHYAEERTELEETPIWGYWYPKPESRKEYGSEIPERVAEVAKEAHLCHSVGAYRAAVVLCRTALEAAVKDQDATGKTLSAKIEMLTKQGLVHPKVLKGMDALRNAGNIAVHDETKLADPQTESLSRLFLKVLDIVLDGLYTKPQVIEEAVQQVTELKGKQDPSAGQKEQS